MVYAIFDKPVCARNRWHQALLGLVLATTLASAHVAVFAGSAIAAPVPEISTTPNQVIKDGVSLQLDMSQSMQEGAEARFTLSLRDAASANPIRNARPIAWVDAQNKADENSEQACRRKVATFIGGDLLHAPALSLNAYYVLALNEDNSISVINPQTGFGGSKLLTMVILKGVGQDWLLTPEQNLWVSQPQVHEVALVDTRNWQVRTHVPVPGHPGQMALRPGAQQVWVLTDDGVTVLSASSGQLLANIKTGQGSHAIAFSDDGKSAFVSNAADNNISLIDAGSLKKTTDIASGSKPVAMAWSSKAQLLYVVHEADGQVIALDTTGRQIASIKALPGISTIRFTPDGRYGFILNPQKNKLDLLDTATNQIVQGADIAHGPDQVTFSDRMAYIRRRHSEIMQLVPLDAIAHNIQAGQPLALASVSYGQKAPDLGRSTGSLADTTVMVPNGAAALLANPADRTIYYYQEGMSAPAGSFRNYGHEPRAVLVLDHSLQERQPGLYQASARLPKAGNYQVVFYLDSPRMLHCFPITVQADPSKPPATRYAVTLAGTTPTLSKGENQNLQFAIRDAISGQTQTGIPDLQVLLFNTTGTQLQVDAHEQKNGDYAISFAPPVSGHYYVYFQAASLGMSWNQSARLVLTVK
ncbi:YncE family protein [Undibacterium sp. Tian12W]|uniref:YncE family protein n=1 Tax=Undibacterium sp. Tian12W TaxID=3413054 RepID=UPI003BF03AB7